MDKSSHPLNKPFLIPLARVGTSHQNGGAVWIGEWFVAIGVHPIHGKCRGEELAIMTSRKDFGSDCADEGGRCHFHALLGLVLLEIAFHPKRPNVAQHLLVLHETVLATFCMVALKRLRWKHLLGRSHCLAVDLGTLHREVGLNLQLLSNTSSVQHLAIQRLCSHMTASVNEVSGRSPESTTLHFQNSLRQIE